VKGLQRLLKCSCREKKICCYGTGAFALRVSNFLLFHKIETAAFCISDGEKVKQESFLGKPVYFLSELPLDFANGLMIVAVSEQYHEVIQQNLLRTGIHHTFFVGKSLMNDLIMPKQIWSDFLSQQILRQCILYAQTLPCNTKEDIMEFEKRLVHLRQQYEKVRVRYLSTSIGGCLLAKKYYDDTFSLNGFLLLYPDNTNIPGSNDFQHPNEAVLERFVGKYYECLCKRNIAFWQYAMQVYPAWFIIEPKETYFNEIMPRQGVELHQGTFYKLGKTYLKFSSQDLKYGVQCLTQLGIEKAFYCIFARDGVYYKKEFKAVDPLLDIMDQYRNSDIDTFQSLIRYMYHHYNLQAVRVGKLQEKIIRCEGVIDYAMKAHSDFLDVFLAYDCEFFIGDSSGVVLLDTSFNKPIALTNMPCVLIHHDGFFPLSPQKDLVIFQKYWNKSKNKFLSFRDMLQIESSTKGQPFQYSGITSILKKYYDDIDLVPVKNTAQEILELGKEMQQRLKGEYIYTEQDEELQGRFCRLRQEFSSTDTNWFWTDARVGAAFLRNNQWLLN